MKVETSSVPVTAILSQERVEHDEGEVNYRITPSIEPVYNRARKVADTDKVNVIILGQTGTGKEHLARFIHDRSARKAHPYITLNCSALNDQLLESRLFGYRKGAFTGADKDMPGLFEEAHGGTIFLDEISATYRLTCSNPCSVYCKRARSNPLGARPRRWTSA